MRRRNGRHPGRRTSGAGGVPGQAPGRADPESAATDHPGQGSPTAPPGPALDDHPRRAVRGDPGRRRGPHPRPGRRVHRRARAGGGLNGSGQHALGGADRPSWSPGRDPGRSHRGPTRADPVRPSGNVVARDSRPDPGRDHQQRRALAARSRRGHRDTGSAVQPARRSRPGHCRRHPGRDGARSVSPAPSGVFFGELGLDGGLRPVRGVLPAATVAGDEGFAVVIVPDSNAAEAALVPGIRVTSAPSLAAVLHRIRMFGSDA